jgi:antitoxin component YwqK of YwqJK toxin-antitoxin module
MQFQPVIAVLFIATLAACNSSAHHNKDPYSLEDTVNYKLTETQQGGGVFMKTEMYVQKEDTAFTYVKVYSYNSKVAAIQFYKHGKKHGPTITYDENGRPQLGTYYRNDTTIDMRPLK